MAQNTNLNISPYFDDFDSDKNYQRVLFKPGTPIQARELTTLQSILQNQIEKFGQHFFNEGSMVIPGQIAYDSGYTCVQVDDSHLGIPVSEYLDKFIGKNIKGEVSGVSAKVDSYITKQESDNSNYTLYIKYTSTSDSNFTTNKFLDGENLISLEDVDYSLSTIRANTTFATTILSNSTATASAAKIAAGVYFIRGFFVSVQEQTVLLEQYTNTPSYRVGLLVGEEFAVASNNYNDLFDSAQGFSNFGAPGADRLVISTALIKKEINNFNDENFIELLRVRNGILEKFVKDTSYNLIQDELAKRTYDESGDYYIRPFTAAIRETLNDRVGNNGVYLKEQITRQGNIPSDNLACISISPGKAYVRGYEVETISNTLLDLEKPRDTERVNNSTANFNLGKQIILNNVYGSIPIGFGTYSQVSLYSDRTTTPGVASGTKVGVARVYDLKPMSSGYVDATSQYQLALYDIQTYTTITLNSNITVSTPAFIEGKNNGATGYLVNDITSSNSLILYQVSGTFILGEPININGENVSRIITTVRDYGMFDIHQFVANTNGSGIGTFTADAILSNPIELSKTNSRFTITDGTSGVSTVTTSETFYTSLQVGDIVSYTKVGQKVPTYNKISTVNNNLKNITITGISSVSGVCEGGLSTSIIESTDFKKVTLEVLNTAGSYLYEQLPNNNISSIDFTNSQIVFKKSYDITVSGNAFSQLLETDSNLLLEPFDEEDYNLTYKNTGVVESLNYQKVTATGRTITLQNLSSNGSATLTVTFRKVNTKSRNKLYNRCSTLIVSNSSSSSSGIGSTTLNDGLTYSNIYGTRVQDSIISLNVPDVSAVIGIFESSTTSDPILPSIILTNLSTSIDNIIPGEKIIGSNSNSVAIFVKKVNTNQIYIIYQNENKFKPGETLLFDESRLTASVSSVNSGDKNIQDNFSLDTGYTEEYLDFSRIIRKSTVAAPTKKIIIIYDCYTIDSNDVGDFVSVSSYDPLRYGKDIIPTNGVSGSDIIDMRPRVLPYSTSTKSPFEYSSRIFSATSNSSPYIFSKDKSIILSYDYYLPRIDRLYLTKDGTFILNKGISALNPRLPLNLDFALEVATIKLPAYLYNTSDARIEYTPHKRYTMKDISRLDDRLSNVEYYTSLSLLEVDTQNLILRDEQTNTNRFKCGFFVDNFRSNNGGDISNPIYRASVDTTNGILRPSHYTTAIDLLLGSESIIGIGTTSNPNADLRYVSDLGSSNVKKAGDVICLNYSNYEYTKNKFATRTENVNPFNVANWIGTIELSPSTDTWIETRKTTRTDDVTGSYASAIQQLGVDSNTGLSAIDWNSAETNWTGENITQGAILSRSQTDSTLINEDTTKGDFIRGRGIPLVTNRKYRDNFVEFRNETVTRTGNRTRTGSQFRVSERYDTSSIGDVLVSRTIIPLLRSRNIEIIARRLKPNTRLYAFFDNINVTEYVIPKLIEVSMESGTFSEGETVIGTLGTKSISFRLANQNHKYGPYNAPTEIYTNNIYSPNNSIPQNYSSSTTILNVDTASLEIKANSNFFGCINLDMKLIGKTSQAVAKITNLRIISDKSGTFIGSLFIPDPTIPSTPSFESGTKTFILSANVNNSTVSGVSDSFAETAFTSSGSIDNVESVTLRIRNANIERIPRSETIPLTETETRTTSNTTFVDRTQTQTRYVDPLAQSFEVTDTNGVFITKCDIYFRTKDQSNIPITLQIRTMQTGFPTQTILPFSEVVLDPDKVTVSDNGTIPTTFEFPSPVYLEGKNQYSIVLISNSNEYNVWISRMTEQDVTTLTLPESERIIVSQQPTLGSLFKSQNGATWDASQYEDLKFTLYRAEFTSNEGTVRFYNPDLAIGNQQVNALRPDPILAYSRSILITLGKSLSGSDQLKLIPGNLITQQNNTTFSGNLKSTLGAIGIGSTLIITNSGDNFSGVTTTYSGIDLITLTGKGSGGKINLTVGNNVAVAATVSLGGNGYTIGDTLTINPTQTGNRGKNLIISIPNNTGIISSFNSIVVDNVQGNLTTNDNNNIISVGQVITGAYPTSKTTIKDGLHFKVDHFNHGMNSSNLNRVTLSGLESDTPPVKLNSDITAASTQIIVSSTSILSSYENSLIGVSNTCYIQIDSEIIGFTTFTGNTLNNITRGVNNTIPTSHSNNSDVFKYEFNGISLLRLNKTHLLSNTDASYPIELDNYHIKIDTTDKYFRTTKSGGTYAKQKVQTNSINGPKATQNIPFSILRPNIQTLLPENTSIESKVRTFTGSSIDGNEGSFIDKGFEDISINSNNLFDSPRAIYSNINESSNLSAYPGAKSLTLEMKLKTSDTKVSPIIDLDRVNVILTSNRIDSPVLDFATDFRVNQLYNDPCSAIYVSKVIMLQRTSNKLQVLFDAYRHSTNDIRVAYKVFRPDSPIEQQLYELFPGYDKLNNGKPKSNVLPSTNTSDFRFYEFSVDVPQSFTGFQIKIIMTGTNQAYVPLIRDLRVIATI